MIIATLCHISKDNKLLLIKKAKGLLGEGKWSAVGGKIKARESVEECTKREVLEETGLKVDNLKEVGTLTFYSGRESAWKVYVFIANSFKGNLKSSREGTLKWIKVHEIPYDNMWEDYRFWLPLLLKNKKFEGNFHFDERFEKLLNHTIKEL